MHLHGGLLNIMVVVVLGLLLFMIAFSFPDTVTVTGSGLEQGAWLWKHKRIRWAEIVEINAGGGMLTITGADGTKIVHTRQFARQARLMTEIKLHCGENLPPDFPGEAPERRCRSCSPRTDVPRGLTRRLRCVCGIGTRKLWEGMRGCALRLAASARFLNAASLQRSSEQEAPVPVTGPRLALLSVRILRRNLLGDRLIDLGAALGTRLGALLTLFVELVLGSQKFNISLLGAVSLLESSANDAQIAAVPFSIARSYGIEEPGDCLPRLQVGESLPAGMQIAFLAQRDQFFDVWTRGLGLGDRRLHAIFEKNRRYQVAQQRAAMAGVPS